MADKIKPLKIENPANGGTQTDYLPTESDPVQDYVAAKGLAFENSDLILLDIDPSTGEIRYKDLVQTTYKKINDITGGSSFDEDKILTNHDKDILVNHAGNVLRRN